MKITKPFQNSKIEQEITDWNFKFPFDFLFRLKYKIPFGGSEHRQMDFFDMKFDIAEEKYFEYLSSRNKNKVKRSKQLLKSRVIKNSDKLTDEEFDDLDLSQFDTKAK